MAHFKKDFWFLTRLILLFTLEITVVITLVSVVLS